MPLTNVVRIKAEHRIDNDIFSRSGDSIVADFGSETGQR
jgi:hypothetical protein